MNKILLFLTLFITATMAQADTKISDYTALASGSYATDDLLVIVDTSTTTTKKTQISDLSTYLASLTQTLTNKTLTSPVINTPTGIVKGDVGLGNVDNTSDATKNAASVTLTNKTIDADDNTISDIDNNEIKASAAIDATKIADGTVTSAEFQYLGGVTSDIQTQFTGKAGVKDIQVFPTSGTWTKPAGAKWVCAYILGGGGQGGSGAVGATSDANAECGGGGGAPATIVFWCWDAEDLGSTETVTIGAGGTSSNGQTSDATNGINGVAGGDTTFGDELVSPGGDFGNGGTRAATCAGTGGAVTISTASPANFASGGGASASTSGGAGIAPSNLAFLGPNGGASGAGITTGDATAVGAAGGGLASSIFLKFAALTGGAAGGAPPADATDGSRIALFSHGGTTLYIGSGGGSSRSSTTTNTGAGGDALANTGAGGGGSGSTVAGFDSGKGGDGGSGWAIVISGM